MNFIISIVIIIFVIIILYIYIIFKLNIIGKIIMMFIAISLTGWISLNCINSIPKSKGYANFDLWNQTRQDIDNLEIIWGDEDDPERIYIDEIKSKERVIVSIDVSRTKGREGRVELKYNNKKYLLDNTLCEGEWNIASIFIYDNKVSHIYFDTLYQNILHMHKLFYKPWERILYFDANKNLVGSQTYTEWKKL